MALIEIDGKQIDAPDGSNIIDVADANGIYIPRFCYHKKLSVAANCRMCLVQVEKAAKPLPACATPVTDGMKIMTNSALAERAQKGVMEFLLINHPLDCPICDQGGECQLQDLAVGFGASKSRYGETKRVVVNKNLGPLIATDMTRCIHCTRCVRFGQEVAGIMELGMTSRGEHSEIGTYVARTVNSEISGNMIDLCPVGALTSKPFRYTARPWELSRRTSISPHCGLGSNLIVQTKQHRVMRVLPRENESINECWLSDRDRFSYQGLNSEDRLTQPMIKQGGSWIETDWQTALEYIANGLKQIKTEHGANQIGALGSPHSTLEELYLLQKLMRGLGSDNIDHRTRQSDFRLDAVAHGAPWLGTSIESIESAESLLIVGSTLRKDHPLLAHRVRVAAKRGCRVSLINPFADDLLLPVAHHHIVAPSSMPLALGEILLALATLKNAGLTSEIKTTLAGVTPSATTEAIARTLMTGGPGAILLGNLAQHHPRYADIYSIAREIATLSGISFGVLGEAANSVGAYLAGAVPTNAGKTGLNAAQMLSEPLKAYIVLGLEAELDSYNPRRAVESLGAAQMVVVLSPYRHHATAYADVMLPIAPFTETSGTFVNTEGKWQSFNAVVRPLGETRPAWKVLRVLGNLLALNGFDYDSSEDVRRELEAAAGKFDNAISPFSLGDIGIAADGGFERIGEVPIYQTDPIVRRAPALQATVDAEPPVASVNGAMLARLGLADGDMIVVGQGGSHVSLPVRRDDGVADHCVRLATAHPLTAELGDMFGRITVDRAAGEVRKQA